MRSAGRLAAASLRLPAKPGGRKPAGPAAASPCPCFPPCAFPFPGCTYHSGGTGRRFFLLFPAVACCYSTRLVFRNQASGLQLDKDMQDLAQQHVRQPSHSRTQSSAVFSATEHGLGACNGSLCIPGRCLLSVKVREIDVQTTGVIQQEPTP